MKELYRLWLHKDLLSRNLCLYVEHRSENPNKIFVAMPIIDTTFREYEMNVRPEPTFEFSVEMAQSLVDQLWNYGVRPSEGSGSAGAMAAVQEHLKDLRRIVFDDKTKRVLIDD